MGPKINTKKMLDPKVFEKALKIIKSKPKKPKEKLWSRLAQRYDIAINTYDVVGCAKAINELKIYFDGTIKNAKKKPTYLSNEALFLKAVRQIAQLMTYHEGFKEKNKHWDSATKILTILKIDAKVLDFRTHGHIFSEWPKPTMN
jgi:RNA polymerase-interacting CarD/CdnL/TRCF family regulator